MVLYHDCGYGHAGDGDGLREKMEIPFCDHHGENTFGNESMIETKSDDKI